MPDILHAFYWFRFASRLCPAARAVLSGLVLVVAAPLPAWAQGAPPAPPGLGVELNSASDASGSCRLTFVANNATGNALEDLQLEMAVFDTGGAARLVTFEFGALQEGRMRVLQFDLPEQRCAAVSLLHVNKVASCRSAGGTEPPGEAPCEGALRLSTRVDAIQLRR